MREHNTLKVTPPMDSGVTNTFWTWERFLGIETQKTSSITGGLIFTLTNFKSITYMAKQKQEYTSKRVATTASKILRSKTSSKSSKSVAGSALTQAKNKPKKK